MAEYNIMQPILIVIQLRQEEITAKHVTGCCAGTGVRYVLELILAIQ